MKNIGRAAPARLPAKSFPTPYVIKASFHMIATVAMIVAIIEKNSSAIVAIYGFHMIAAIKFNMAVVDSCLKVVFFILMGAFQRKRRRKRQRTLWAGYLNKV